MEDYNSHASEEHEKISMQMVLITDPTLAMNVLYSSHFDKFGFAYSFLDPVSLRDKLGSSWNLKIMQA